MGVRDLRFGDALTTLTIGAVIGGAAVFMLSHLTGVQFRGIGAPPDVQVGRARAYAYPSEVWDLRDPGSIPASFSNIEDYPENSIPVDGMFNAPPPNFEDMNFSEAYGPAPYTAPRTL